jgi:hypothetical protein
MSVSRFVFILSLVYTCIYKEKESGDTMSANVYNVQSLLVGTNYYSNTLQGEIVSAEPHPKAVWYQDCDTYLVEVEPNSGYNNWGKRTYRTVAVKRS